MHGYNVFFYRSAPWKKITYPMVIKQRQRQYGFSLVELSVVLVIIGLLVGGVTMGNELIRQYEIQTTVSQIGRYRTAVNGFLTAYNGLPGDITNATDYWGSQTANGDGDKLIVFRNNYGSYEGYRAWQHLGLAEMVNGYFTGTTTTGVAIPGIDLPAGKLGSSAYTMEHGAMDIGEALVFLLGKPAAGTTTMKMQGALRPEEAMQLDDKMDDGRPNDGTVRGREGETSPVGSCVLDGAYDTDKVGRDCFMGFVL